MNHDVLLIYIPASHVFRIGTTFKNMKAMKGSSLTDLIESVDSVILKNRGSLSESDLQTLLRCKSKLQELEKAEHESDGLFWKKTVVEATLLMLKYFFQD